MYIITSEYIIPNITMQKNENVSSFVSEFERFVNDSVDDLNFYIRKFSMQYTLNGKKITAHIKEVYEDKVKDIQHLAILFSELKKQEKKEANKTIIEQIQKTAQNILHFVFRSRTKQRQKLKSVVLWRTNLCKISNLLIYSNKKRKSISDYEPIRDGEVRFSLLFKEFAEEGVLPKDYIYDKVREYLVDLGIIMMKDMDSNGVSKRISFVTDDALDKGILRIIGCKKYGDSVIYSYVFTVNGIEFMRKLFSRLDENKKLELFTYMDIAGLRINQ